MLFDSRRFSSAQVDRSKENEPILHPLPLPPFCCGCSTSAAAAASVLDNERTEWWSSVVSLYRWVRTSVRPVTDHLSARQTLNPFTSSSEANNSNMHKFHCVLHSDNEPMTVPNKSTSTRQYILLTVSMHRACRMHV